MWQIDGMKDCVLAWGSLIDKLWKWILNLQPIQWYMAKLLEVIVLKSHRFSRKDWTIGDYGEFKDTKKCEESRQLHKEDYSQENRLELDGNEKVFSISLTSERNKRRKCIWQ